MAATQMARFKSREYLDLVKSIGECKSKIEEDAIMKNEVRLLSLYRFSLAPHKLQTDTLGLLFSRSLSRSKKKSQVVYLKRRLADPKLDKSKIREYLLRLLYVELLGHDASFGHIHAVKLCSDASVINKKGESETASLCLPLSAALLTSASIFLPVPTRSRVPHHLPLLVGGV